MWSRTLLAASRARRAARRTLRPIRAIEGIGSSTLNSRSSRFPRRRLLRLARQHGGSAWAPSWSLSPPHPAFGAPPGASGHGRYHVSSFTRTSRSRPHFPRRRLPRLARRPSRQGTSHADPVCKRRRASENACRHAAFPAAASHAWRAAGRERGSRDRAAGGTSAR